MHVVFRDGLHDQDYLERHTRRAPRSCASARASGRPARTAETTGLPAAEVEWFARAYATTRPSAIRINYGLQRHAGGGMAVRTIACLPAVTGAWRDVGRRRRCSPPRARSPSNNDALERPDLVPPGTRTLNMSQLGRVLTDAALDPPVKALFVYNSNPAAVAPDQESVREGLAARGPVHGRARAVPHRHRGLRRHRAARHHHPRALRHPQGLRPPLPEPEQARDRSPRRVACPNTELFRRLAARMGLDHPCLRETDEEMARQAMHWSHPNLAGVTFERLEREGSVRLSRARSPRAVRGGRLPDPVRQVRAPLAESLGRRWASIPLADYVPPRESVTTSPELARRYPARLHLAAGPPLPELDLLGPAGLRAARGRAEPHHAPARRRGARASREGGMVRVFNDRGSFLAKARVSDAARPGLVVGLSVWWAKMCPGGRNANAVTGQELTDMGEGATFYDVLVDVRRRRGGLT